MQGFESAAAGFASEAGTAASAASTAHTNANTAKNAYNIDKVNLDALLGNVEGIRDAVIGIENEADDYQATTI